MKGKEEIKKNSGIISFESFELLGEPVMVINNDCNLTFINQNACKYFGYTSKYLIKKNISLILPGFNSNSLRNLKQEKALKFNGRNKKNQTLYLQLFLGSYKGAGKTLYIISVKDISKRKKLSDQLNKTGISYTSLLENVPLAVSILDAHTDKFVFVNIKFVQQTGYTLDEINSLSKKDFYELIYPGDRDLYYEKFKKWEAAGFKGAFNHEYRIITKNNRLLWVDASFYPQFDSNGKLNSVYQVFADISGRIENFERLQLLGSAIESAAEMICITDLNNRFIFINKAFRDKYGYNENEILGKEVEIIGSKKNLPEIHQIVFNHTKTGSWEGELINKGKDGTEFPVLLTTSQIKDKSGNVLGYIGVARDITEHKNEYDNLRHSLKEKELLLKEVYHRVKNNMQVISSLLSIQSQSVKETAAAELLKETQNRVRIMQLIHEKLYKSQDLSRIDFSHYIRDLTDQLRRAYPVSKNIALKIKSEGIYLGVDKAIPCGLIINELVSNAYKYAFKNKSKGEIYIELTSPETGKYLLIVKDDGKGISPDIDIHETESLGMMLVTTLTEQLEGSLELNRKGGTKFTIRF